MKLATAGGKSTRPFFLRGSHVESSHAGALAVVEVKLILYAIKKGPFHEQETFSAPAPEAPATPVAAPAVA